MSSPPPTIGIVGAGKVGATLARLLHQAGWLIENVYNRTPSHAETLAGAVNAAVVEHLADVRGELIIIAVADDAIALVAAEMAQSNLDWHGRGVVHTSGALSADFLAPLAARGAWTGGLHPAYPFSGVVESLKGTAFVVETESPVLREWLSMLGDALGAVVLPISGRDKPLYHAALVMASNYTVTLYGTAARLLEQIGVESVDAKLILMPLLEGTLANLQAKLPAEALTGPLTRADTGTISGHLEVLAQTDPNIAAAYAALARLSLPLLRERGLSTAELKKIQALLTQETNHANHST